VSINLIGREFIHTDATASVAVQTFSTPTALVVGTSVDDTNVVASKISLDVAALDTTPSTDTRIFATTAELALSRVNLVRFSEEFDEFPIWAPQNLSYIAPDAFFAPNGTLTADALKHTSTTATIWSAVNQNVPVKPNTQYYVTMYTRRIQPPDFADAMRLLVSTAGGNQAVYMNLLTGVPYGATGAISNLTTSV
jgi:hypothetical protein